MSAGAQGASRHASISETPLPAGVAGLGYWGPNLARKSDALTSMTRRWCCDGLLEARERFVRQFRDARFTDEPQVLHDAPSWTPSCSRPRYHPCRARCPHAGGPEALLRGEAAGPVRRRRPRREGAASVAQCAHGRAPAPVPPGVNKLKEIADSGELGDIRYIYGNRLNLARCAPTRTRSGARSARCIRAPASRGRGALRVRARRPFICAPGSRTSSSRSCVRFGPRGPSASVVARSPQGAALHRRGLQAHGDVRRQGPRAQDHHLRQGLRREPRRQPALRRALGRHLVASRAAAEPLRLECEHFVDCVRNGRADLRRAQRRRRRARARGPAGLAGREPPRAGGSRPSSAPSALRRPPRRPERGPAPGSSGSPGGCGRPRRSPAARRLPAYSAIAGWRCVGVR